MSTQHALNTLTFASLFCHVAFEVLKHAALFAFLCVFCLCKQYRAFDSDNLL